MKQFHVILLTKIKAIGEALLLGESYFKKWESNRIIKSDCIPSICYLEISQRGVEKRFFEKCNI